MAKNQGQVVAGLALKAGELVIIDPDLSTALRRENWSPSAMGSAEKCLAAMAAGRLLPEAPDPWADNELGTSAHQVFELLYALEPQHRTLDSALDIISTLHLTHPDDVVAPQNRADVMRWQAEIIRRVEPLWKAEDPQKVPVAAREIRADGISVGGVPFVGLIDRVDYVSAGSAEVSDVSQLAGVPVVLVDYKAGKDKTKPARGSFASHIAKYGDEHGDQLRLYALALREITGVVPHAAQIIYTQTGSRYVASLTEPELAGVQDRFANSFHTFNAAVDAGVFPYKPGALCGWCPLVGVCPGGASVKAKPKSERAFAGVRAGVRVDTAAVPVTLVKQRPPRVLDPAFEAARQALAKARGVGEVPTPVSVAVDVTHPDGRTLMSTPIFAGPEGKPYEAHLNDRDKRRLDPNTYEATAVIALSNLAVEALHEAGRPISPKERVALARTLAYVTNVAQDKLSGRVDLQTGLHTRIRGTLRTVLDIHPLPFGGDDPAWEAWVNGAVLRIEAILTTGLDLFVFGPGERPWADLAVQPGNHTAVTPTVASA